MAPTTDQPHLPQAIVRENAQYRCRQWRGRTAFAVDLQPTRG
jgi:hypothetical protein